MNKVSFDYESFSECDLKKTGSWVYSEHPSTRVICMGYAYNDDNPELWVPGDKLPEFLLEKSHGEFEIHAWNIGFERDLTEHVLKIKMPPVEYLHDTMARAAAMALPRGLANCAEVVGLTGDKGKDKRGKKLIQLLSIPQKLTKKKLKEGFKSWDTPLEYKNKKGDETYRSEDPELLQEMYDYCKKDVIVERAVGKKLLQLSPSEREVWELDQEVNIRGIQLDSPLIEDCIDIYETEWLKLFYDLKELTGLENPNSHLQFLPWLKENGYTEDNTQAETLREFLKGIEK